MNRFTWIAALAFLLLFTGVPAPAQTTIHVDDDAPNDPGPGDTSISDPLEDGSLLHPFDAIQEGIDASVNGDTVLVADGLYTGVGNRDIDFLGRAITVQSDNGPDNCVLDGSGTYGYRGFIFHNGEGAGSRLEGFTINDFKAFDGSGIRCSSASPSIIGNVISNGYANDGGGIYLYKSSAVIDGNTISGCVAGSDVDSGDGGGICGYGTGNVRIWRNTISDNHANGGGGGIYCEMDAASIIGNTIRGNTCDTYEGGGLSIRGCTTPVIAHNLITDNHAHDAGTWASAYGGGVSCVNCPAALILNNRITDNLADHVGGGIYLSWSASALLANNLIAGNEAKPAYEWGGGGICCGSASITMVNTTLVGNTGDKGGGLYLDSDTSVTMTNSIVRDNIATAGDQIRLGYNSGASIELTVAHNDIQGGESAVLVMPGGTLNWAPGNIDADPLFVTGSDGDYYLSQVAAGQGADSPCVDAGLNLAAVTCWTTTTGIECLSSFTTRTDGINDQGVADMGYHYPALDPMSAWLSCEPSSGTLPFATTIALGLVNNLDGDYRQVAGHLDIVLGNGTAFPNWRAGHLVLGPGESHTISWNQLIPEILPAYGDNRFTLMAEDVTPAPWNQPPYPPSGSTDWARCTVTGEYE